MIRLYDGNNYTRLRAASDFTGRPISGMYREIDAHTGVSVVVWDGRGALARRRKIYPDYKAQREPGAENIYASMDLLKALLKLSQRAVQIELPGYEADDVIAHLAGRYGNQIEHLYSNDGDLAALGIPMEREETKIEPHWIRLYKATVGDPADNIPGIKGFGKGTWDTLDDHDRRQLESFLAGETDFDQVVAPLPKRVTSWLLEPANVEQARIYYQVVGFIPIPRETVDAAMTHGVAKPVEAYQILDHYEI